MSNYTATNYEWRWIDGTGITYGSVDAYGNYRYFVDTNTMNTDKLSITYNPPVWYTHPDYSGNKYTLAIQDELLGESKVSNQLRYDITVIAQGTDGVTHPYNYVGYPGKCSVGEVWVTIHELMDGEDAWHYFSADTVLSVSMMPITR